MRQLSYEAVNGCTSSTADLIVSITKGGQLLVGDAFTRRIPIYFAEQNPTSTDVGARHVSPIRVTLDSYYPLQGACTLGAG